MIRCELLKRVQSVFLVSSLAACLFLGGCQKENAPPQSNGGSTSPAVSGEQNDTSGGETGISHKNNVGQTISTEGDSSSSAAEEAGFQLQNDSKTEIVRAYCTAFERTAAAGGLQGTEHVSILKGTLRLGGKSNAVAQTYVSSQIGRYFNPRTGMPLPLTETGNGHCMVEEADIKIASRRENEAQTVIKLISKDDTFPVRGKGGAGNLMDVPDLAQLKQFAIDNGLAFSNDKGFDENVTIEFLGAECTVTVAKDTGLITQANYRFLVFVQAEHVSVSVFKNLDVAATICYEMNYPG